LCLSTKSVSICGRSQKSWRNFGDQ
jgi:hypothetical protein